MNRIKLKEIAFGRSGDKGNISNVYIIPYRGSDLSLLLEELTAEFVEEVYGELVQSDIERYTFDGIGAINFVMHDALSGGVSSSLNLDMHGKSRAALLLQEEIRVPDDYTPPETVDGTKEWSR
jgi:hypothetical protein